MVDVSKSRWRSLILHPVAADRRSKNCSRSPIKVPAHPNLNGDATGMYNLFFAKASAEQARFQTWNADLIDTQG